MTPEEIQIRKAELRNHIRARMRGWQPWAKIVGMLFGAYLLVYVLCYGVWWVTGQLVTPDLREGMRFLNFPTVVANAFLAIQPLMFALIYVYIFVWCPVTGPFAIKLKRPGKLA